MSELNSKNIRVFAGFLNRLAKDMTSFYYAKLNKPFKVNNKLKFTLLMIADPFM